MKLLIANKHSKVNATRLYQLTKKEGLQPGDPRWDGTPATHCNEYVYEAAVLLGFDPWPLLETQGIGWTSANSMYSNAREEVVEGLLKEHTALSAQKAANRGRFIIAMAFNIYDGSGHVAVVTANSGIYLESEGPRITQAGSENGVFMLNMIFNEKTLTPPMFVELEKI